MNKYLGLGVVALLLIVIVMAVYDAKDDRMENEAMENDDAMMEGDAMDDDSMMTEDAMENDEMMSGDMEDSSGNMEGDMMMKSGSYETYSPEKLSQAENGDVVLFFNASWCPTCRAAVADINAHLSDIPEGLTILSVDYDSSSDLKKKYGVTYQHTFVQVDAQGNMIKKWSGSPTLAALTAEVQ